MVARNEFQAYRKKNKTGPGSSHCRAIAKLTAFALLLLSPFVTHANDTTQKLRGKDNDLGNLSSESIDVIHVPVQSDSIGLSTGEGEDSSHLSHIAHESSMLDEALVQGAESIDKTPVGDGCHENEDCESNICETRAPHGSCWPASKCCVDTPGMKMPIGARCMENHDCVSGYCNTHRCANKLSNGESCEDDRVCSSGESCVEHYDCAGAECSNNKCKGLRIGANCDADWKCESDACDGKCYTPGPCFSSTSMVNHMSHGLVPISDINIGDYIQSNIDGSFSRVYAFKKNNHEDTEFYQLQSRTGTLLEVTDRHLVFLKNKSLPIAARDVRVGDVLKSGNPEDDTEVVKIELIHREGYYNPFTESGTFVLNEGVVASSYDVSSSSSSDFFDGPTEMIHWHTLAHFACAPLRFVCKTMNFDVCSDADNHNEDGLHKFIVFLTTLRKLKDWQQVAVLPVIFGAGVLSTLLEFFYDLGEAFYETISSTSAEAAAQDDGSFGFLITFSLTVAALVPSAIFLWRKKYHLSCD